MVNPSRMLLDSLSSRARTALVNAGYTTDKEVHGLIDRGEVRSVPGIGATTEKEILHLYQSVTTTADLMKPPKKRWTIEVKERRIG